MLIHVDFSGASLNVRISEVRNSRDHQQLVIVIFLYHKFEFYQNLQIHMGQQANKNFIKCQMQECQRLSAKSMTILKYQTHDDSLFPQTSLVKFVLIWSCASCSGHTALTIFSIRLGSFDSFHSHYIKDNAYFGTFDIEMKISI